MVTDANISTAHTEPTHTAYLSLGSNIGDRQANLTDGLVALGEHGAHLVRQSSLYLTEPVEGPPQDWFLNLVVETKTLLTPEQLLHVALNVERAFGRHRIVRRGPRTLDIDILFYDSRVIATAELDIPHPRIAFRRFVLEPLAQIAPSFCHPVLHKTIEELLAATPDHSRVEIWTNKST